MSESADARPVLHVVAGPNGAGKTTLYQTVLQARLPGVEFVNADELALAAFGHSATTLAESQHGQQLADERRAFLMEHRKSLVTESTFSHPSKLALLQDAKDKGYELRVYHVNVRSAELSVLRVQSRVESGGHPVPEDKIRERYVRNQALIQQAVRQADRAYIFDNSKLGEPHRLAMGFRQGEVVRINDPVPSWARQLYAQDLARFEPARVNAPAASFEAAAALSKQVLSAEARLFIARPEGRYAGEIIGLTSQHAVQRLSGKAAVAHFIDRLPRKPLVGERLVIQYPAERGGAVNVQPQSALRPQAVQPSILPMSESSAGRQVPPGDASVPSLAQRLDLIGQQLNAAEGQAMAGLLEALRAGHTDAVQQLLKTTPQLRTAVRALMKDLGAEPREPGDNKGQGTQATSSAREKPDAASKPDKSDKPGRDR